MNPEIRFHLKTIALIFLHIAVTLVFWWALMTNHWLTMLGMMWLQPYTRSIAVQQTELALTWLKLMREEADESAS